MFTMMFKVGALLLLLVLALSAETSASVIAREAASPHLKDVDLVTDPCGFAFFNGKYHLFYEFFELGNGTRTPAGNYDGFAWRTSTPSKIRTRMLKTANSFDCRFL